METVNVNKKGKITYFCSAKNDNTEETFRLAREKMEESGIGKIVLASTIGPTARRAMDFFKDTDVQLIVIPHQYDFLTDTNRFPEELVKELRQSGHEVHFGTMLFHTEKLYGSSIPNVISDFLRCFCEGVKVCYEIVLMASDAGLLAAHEKVIAIAGTGRGSDTALVMHAASSRNLKKMKITEILCKPMNE